MSLMSCGLELRWSHLSVIRQGARWRRKADRKEQFESKTTSTPYNNSVRGLVMTSTLRTSKIAIVLAAAIGTILFTGCAGVGSANTTSLLTAAGFRARTPQTPKQQQMYAALPPYQVQRATVKGQVFYVYKDEKA